MTGETLYERGWAFIIANGRLLDRRAFEHRFEGGSSEAVVRAVDANANDDGGYGNAIEPDKLTPHSQPLDVDVALRTVCLLGLAPSEAAQRTPGFLQSIADDAGMVPLLLPTVLDFPRASHYADVDDEASLTATAGIAASMHALGMRSPWLERATETCFRIIEASPPDDAHRYFSVLRFLEHVPDQDRATGLAERVGPGLVSARYFKTEPAAAYGLSPLRFAPSPSSCWRALFDDTTIDGHLDALAAGQQDDGGWEFAWAAPSDASHLAWRCLHTLEAVSVLEAYGRMRVPGR